MNRQNRLINNRKALMLIRSVKLPVVMAGAIIANFIWKRANKRRGISKDNLEWLRLTFLNKTCWNGLPMNPLILSPNDKLNPTKTQIKLDLGFCWI